MSKIPFAQRFGPGQSKPIDNDFPKTARVALAYLLQDLVHREYVDTSQGDGEWGKWGKVITELHRVGRQHPENPDNIAQPFELCMQLLEDMGWTQIYTFCERVCSQLLTSTGYMEDATVNGLSIPEGDWVETTSISEVQKYYADELNNILAEENLAYHFSDGQFQRRGRTQTQKNIRRVGAVLADPYLSCVCDHYNQARKFFNERPATDVEHCVQEALRALEACLEILTKKPASKEFTRVVRQLEGNDPGQIPPPVAQGMIKLYGYRGGGQGGYHPALGGDRISAVEAELVLNLVASYITYLVDLLAQPEEIPF
jgi:hypothetical protein